MLTKTKMHLAAGIQYLKCRCIKRPDLLNQKIENDTTGIELLWLQEDNKVNWKEYTFQEVINAVAVESTVEAVDTQYVEQLEED